MTKHLEELEKELDELLQQQYGFDPNASIGVNAGLRDEDYNSYVKSKGMNKLLVDRQILQAYDAIEEVKRFLKSVVAQNITSLNKPSQSISYYNDPELYREVYEGDVLQASINFIRTYISDYEWEWLKLQDKENKDE